MWMLRSLLAVMILGLLVPASHSAELERLTRLSATESKPWRGVGRVNVQGLRRTSMCTGTLIREDLVLTAAHCLVNQRTGKPYRPASVHFVAGWHQGKKTGHSIADAFFIHPDYVNRANPTVRQIETDIALIQLRHPLTTRAAETFDATEPPLPGEMLTLVSYRRDRPNALTYQDDCDYRSIIGQILTLECQVAKGASGAPVFMNDNGRARVVAVLSAMGNSGHPRAYAVRADTALSLLMGAVN